VEPTATGHILEQIEMIEKILENGFAYEVDGSVYFDVKKYLEKHDYGKLSGKKVDELIEGHRVLDGQEIKKNSNDFALWKKATPEHIMRWNSPWSVGYPGWHLECSVMSTKYLGETFDIHGGGMDLKFPHHEDEIAQSVGAGGAEPVKYWLHGNMLTVEGQKMSKSLGNVMLPDQLLSGAHPLLDKGFSPMAIRFFILQSHYRSTLDFSNQALRAAEKGYRRLMNSYESLMKISEEKAVTADDDFEKEIMLLCSQAKAHLDDDFSTPQAIARLFDIANKINTINDKKIKVTAKTLTLMKTTFKDFIESVLGFKKEEEGNQHVVNGLMELVMDIRKQSRDNKDWATSDKIRDQLTALNIQLKDGKEGTTWAVN
jgi:cysteinyl-tRNA synthetase